MKNKNLISLLCILSAILTGVCEPAMVSLAKKAEVVVDETEYVTCDYYGKTKKVEIVKACEMNGNTKLMDYGHYDSVKNMSSLDEPNLKEDGVEWKLPKKQKDQRFYFEVTPREDSVFIPFFCDVSYLLNGKQIKAKKLTGASGLVEINAHVMPNKNLNTYFKNNFMLIAAMAVDTDNGDTLRAEGAQFLTVGTMEVAAFACLPQDEEDFRFEIGTECFENSGLILMMMPLTLGKLDDIDEINEHKKNLEDASDSLNKTMDDMLDLTKGLRQSIVKTSSGLRDLESAWNTVDEKYDKINKSLDRVSETTNDVRKSLKHLSGATGDDELYNYLIDMSATMDHMADDLENSFSDLEDVVSDMEDAEDDMESIISSVGTMPQVPSALSGAISIEISSMDDVIDDTENAIDSARELSDDLRRISDSFSGTSDEMLNMMGLGTSTLQSAEAMLLELDGLVAKTRGTMDSARPSMNAGMHLSPSGMAELLDQLNANLIKIDDVKNNKKIIADIIENEWDRLNDDYHLLDIDTDATKESFTSLKNPEPRSLQIILRTREFELPDEDTTVEAIEEEDIGVWGRLKAVFNKVFSTFL